jgi:hopene-associated glycosyltransferase HpnB
MTTLVLMSVACAAWAYLLAGRGGFWRAAQRDDAPPAQSDGRTRWPSVAAVIPARDEADVIGASVESLLAQDYRGAFSVIVVDDHSSDDTAGVCRLAAAREAPGRVTVIAAPHLPDGWSGKLWALEHGIRHAESLLDAPDYLLLTDADIRHAPDSVSALVARADREDLVLNSLMAKLHCASLAERASIPAFVFFFQMLYPFAWVNRRTRATAAAAGGCMLVRRQALRQAGGIDAIRGELIDDCAMARLLKRHGAIRIALTERVHSMRSYRSFVDIRRMVVRCAFTQLELSVPALVCTTAALLVVFVAPPIVAIVGTGTARGLAALAWVCMALAFQPTLRRYRLSPAWGIALPAIAAGYGWLTVDSALQHLRGRGGEWKGRVHARAASDAGPEAG